MSKPILIVRVPTGICLSKESLISIQAQVSEQVNNEYYVFVLSAPDLKTDSERTEVKFEVFYEKDFNEVKYEELKEIIKQSLNK